MPKRKPIDPTKTYVFTGQAWNSSCVLELKDAKVLNLRLADPDYPQSTYMFELEGHEGTYQTNYSGSLWVVSLEAETDREQVTVLRKELGRIQSAITDIYGKHSLSIYEKEDTAVSEL